MDIVTVLKMIPLGRIIHPKYKSNLILMIIVPLLGIIAGIYSLVTNNDLWIAIQAGFWMSAAATHSWALAREIDPDNDWSAFIAMALQVVVMFALNFPTYAIIGLVMMMLFLRLVNGIVGIKVSRNDAIKMLVLVLVVAFFDNWILGLVAACAFFLNATMSNSERSNLYFAGLAVIIVIVRGIINLGQMGSMSTTYLIIAVAIGIFYILTMLGNRSVSAKTDVKAKPVDIKRVRAAMALGLVAVIILALWRGDAGVLAMSPLWAAMLGISIYRIPITVRELTAFKARQEA